MFKAIFTWWNGPTIGAWFTIKKRAVFVGEDAYGNRYYEAKKIIDGDADRRRRWVAYRGYAEASKVPAEWHGWLHHPSRSRRPRSRCCAGRGSSTTGRT